jgi:hypothetical protein
MFLRVCKRPLVTRASDENELSLLPVELVAHVTREFLEFALGLGVIAFDHNVVEVPEPPAEVLEPLTLLEVSGHFGANLPGLGQGLAVVHVVEGDERLVALRILVKTTVSKVLTSKTRDVP